MENWIHVPYVQFVTPALSPDRIVPYGFEKPTVPVTNASSDGYVTYVWILESRFDSGVRRQALFSISPTATSGIRVGGVEGVLDTVPK